MKKGQIAELTIDELTFPNKGVGMCDGYKIVVKNTLPGQKVEVRIGKVKDNEAEAKIMSVLQPANYEIEPECSHFGVCGGCAYQTVPYDMQVKIKTKQVKDILDEVLNEPYEMLETIVSPKRFEYRNKMEFSFGDEVKEGPLTLGMHKKGSFHGVINTSNCCIVDEDFRKILCRTVEYFQGNSTSYFHKTTKIGFLRYLIVRKTVKNEEILINLVTSTQGKLNESEFVEMILSSNLQGKVKCIAHSLFDGVADIAKADEMKILFGTDQIQEELLGLKFNISSYSFFQTNSLGAEKLYGVIRDFIGETKDKVIFDLYSGTGTIGQILAPKAKKVIGIEIVEEAVEKANQNAKLNNLDNCTFIAGDVLNKIDELDDKPEIIVLDPPREGIHPKAIQKIIEYNPETFIYVSCKASSMLKDLPYFMERGYSVEKVQCVDMFPGTPHVECVCLLTRVK